MEEINDNPFQINSSSSDIKKVLSAGSLYMNRKRKFQDDISALPLPKHVCSVRSDIPSEDVSGTRDYQLESKGSDNDSNSFDEVDDSFMSVTNDRPSTSSVNWGGNSSRKCLFSVDSKPMTKLMEIGDQVHYVCGEHNLLNPNHDEEFLEYGKYGDYNSSEYGYEGVVVCEGKDVEDLLYSEGASEKNFILSSGRWTVNQETQQETKKMTIDKEFEQYFSTLML